MASATTTGRTFITDTDETFPLIITQKYGLPLQQGMQF